ncbi:MAG: lysylphosphatidylglycerol synthase transmembrane domain-containing protein, partial [Chloroflexota bacterium]
MLLTIILDAPPSVLHYGLSVQATAISFMTYLTRILFIIILGILTLALLLQFGEFELSLATLQSLNLGYLILAICIHYSGFFVRGLRWKNLLGALDYPLSITYTTSLLLAGWFVSAVLPARLGDVARLTMLHRDHQIPIAQGVASVASERALDILAILGLMMITAFWALAGQVPSFVWQLAAGGAGLLILFVIICVISPNLENWFLNLLSWPIYQKVVKFGFDLLANLRRLGQRPKLLLWVISLSIYIWLCDVLLMHLLFLSMGQTIAFSVSAFSSMVADMAAAVPVVP